MLGKCCAIVGSVERFLLLLGRGGGVGNSSVRVLEVVTCLFSCTVSGGGGGVGNEETLRIRDCLFNLKGYKDDERFTDICTSV